MNVNGEVRRSLAAQFASLNNVDAALQNRRAQRVNRASRQAALIHQEQNPDADDVVNVNQSMLFRQHLIDANRDLLLAVAAAEPGGC